MDLYWGDHCQSKLDALCAAGVTILSEQWRDINHASNDGHCDTSSDISGFAGDDVDAFGPHTGPTKPVELWLGTEPASLPLTPPGMNHCGVGYASWLSGWEGPHVTGDGGDGGPPDAYAVPFPVANLPVPGDAALTATVCFNGPDECDFHAAVRVAHCGNSRLGAPSRTDLRPRLLHGAAAGRCAARPVDHNYRASL